MLRIRRAQPLEGRTLRLTLTDGSIVERDISEVIWGPVFERLATDDAFFHRVRVRYGTVPWPGDVDIAPETMIWDSPDPKDPDRRPPAFLRVQGPRARV